MQIISNEIILNNQNFIFVSFSKVQKTIAMGLITKVMLLFGILHVSMSSTSVHVPKKSYIERDVHTYEST